MVPATVLAETCCLIDRTLRPTAEAAFCTLASASVLPGTLYLLEKPVGVRAPTAALPEQFHLGGALAREHRLDLRADVDDLAPVTSLSFGPM